MSHPSSADGGTDSRLVQVSCDGGGGPLGHPKVYINLDKPGPQSCPYCGLRYEFVPYEQLAAASTDRET